MHLRVLDLNDTVLSYLTVGLDPYFIRNSALKDEDKLIRLDQWYKKYEQSYGSFDKIIQQFSPTCEEVIVSCSLYLDELNATECCERIFKEKVLTSMGYCFSSHTSGLTQQRFTNAKGFKVTMLFKAGSWIEDELIDITTVMEGGHMFPSSFNEIPTGSVYSNGKIIPPGTYTIINLRKERIDRRNLRSNIIIGYNCSEFNEDLSRVTPYSQLKEYSRVNCLSALYAQGIFRYCKCAILGFTGSSSSSMKICNPAEAIKCMKILNSPKNLTSQETVKSVILKEEHTICPFECLHSVYSEDVERSELSQNMIEDLTETLNISLHKGESLSVIKVHYETHEVRSQIHISQGVSDWLANIGGHAGLFLGASFISFIEVGSLLVTLCTNLFRGLKGKREVRHGSCISTVSKVETFSAK